MLRRSPSGFFPPPSPELSLEFRGANRALSLAFLPGFRVDVRSPPSPTLVVFRRDRPFPPPPFSSSRSAPFCSPLNSFFKPEDAMVPQVSPFFRILPVLARFHDSAIRHARPTAFPWILSSLLKIIAPSPNSPFLRAGPPQTPCLSRLKSLTQQASPPPI